MKPYPFLAATLLVLLAGLWSGLLRLPVPFPFAGPGFSLSHGAFMVPGFLGTVIAVERSAALDRPAAWLVPLVNGLGALLLVAASLLPGLRLAQGASLLLAVGSLGLVLLYVPVLRAQRTLFNLEMALGAAGLLLGNIQWITHGVVSPALPGWLAFLLLTIAGERLELNRLMRPRRAARIWHLAMLVLLACALIAALGQPVIGVRLFAVSMVSFALWFLTNDLAKRTIRISGQPRYSAVCLLAGYAWLGISGAIWLARPGLPAGPLYDAVLHAVLVGFVMSMISDTRRSSSPP